MDQKVHWQFAFVYLSVCLSVEALLPVIIHLRSELLLPPPVVVIVDVVVVIDTSHQLLCLTYVAVAVVIVLL